MKILVAEDDENSRQLLETILASQGYQVISFENGLRALTYLQANTVDLIISDILMPEMDGYGLCRAVKQNYVLQHIPFMFYTATYTSAQDEKLGLSLGAAKFLLKPMLMEDLLREVKFVLNNEHQTKGNKRGLYRASPIKLDKQHADRVREKLDKKVVELDREKQKLSDTENRFKDFAEASADWFWETDDNLVVSSIYGAINPLLDFKDLKEVAMHCHSHSANDMLKNVQQYKPFSDYIVQLFNQQHEAVYIRLSAKPIIGATGLFIGYRGVAKNVTETVSLINKIEFLASHDELTGLPNRHFFRESLEHGVAKAARDKKKLLVIFFDLDNFKMVNDTLGHDAGDALLVLAAKRINESLRSSDVLCRLGGDEFVMLMDNASAEDGHRVAHAIVEAFNAPFELKGKHIFCTTSVGVSIYPDDTANAQALLVFADLAMYRAKQNGRNSFQFYTSNLNSISKNWIETEQGLRHALKDNHFYLVYQPQIDVKTKRIIGMEALIRWQHPERGVVLPLEFIQVAEHSSLISDIGDWVVDNCFKQIRTWLDAGLKIPRVSVNISARQLRSDNFGHQLQKLAEKYTIPMELVCVEITEHALLEEVESVRINMHQINQLGCQISLDDFGMGHSSLLYVKRCHINEVKIDRSFIDSLAENKDDQAIVNGIIALAHALGLKVIGEGVETQAQADILTACGCQYLQGYLYARPLSAADMQAQLIKQSLTA